MAETFSLKGHLVDIINRQIIDGEMIVNNGTIEAIKPVDDIAADAPYYLPGFIDSHVHIESSMMTPAAFARIAVTHGTTGVVTDPHEIANVIGVEGIDFMIRSGQTVRFNFCFGAPSCVPSCGSAIETSGAVLDSVAVSKLLEREDIGFLSEMMNFPGVLGADPEVMAKIDAAKRFGKPVDGHAPGLVGDSRRRYAAAGISTDHECSTVEEGRECILSGMDLLIREGSAARNFAQLIPLLGEFPDRVMFCTDDSHPGDLMQGHINRLVKRALGLGYDLWDVLQAACVNPVRHYGLPWGLLREGDPADFIAIDNLTPDFRVLSTFIQGCEVFSGESLPESPATVSENDFPNLFVASPLTAEDIRLEMKEDLHVIVAEDGSLLTGDEEFAEGMPAQKIVVLNRYVEGAKPSVGLIRGFDLQNGALAASIAHDCHNIVAIGSDDEQLLRAINRVIEMKGGAVAVAGERMASLPLPIAGIISPLDGQTIASRSDELCEVARQAGCPLKAPFITMSFMCLPVIPSLKLTDKGLFDSLHFQFVG